MCLSPGSRGYGTRQRILPRYGSLIPARVNTHGITDDPMRVLDAMHLKAVLRVYGERYAHHRRQEGKHHGCRGRGRRALVAGYVPVRSTERESDLPLHHRLHQQSHDRAHGSRRNAFWFLQPYRADGGGMLDPAQARCHGAIVFLIRLAPLGLWTPLWSHRGGQDGPPRRVLGGGTRASGCTTRRERSATWDVSAFGGRPRRRRFWGEGTASPE
jgi:hypothetical protein